MDELKLKAMAFVNFSKDAEAADLVDSLLSEIEFLERRLLALETHGF